MKRVLLCSMCALILHVFTTAQNCTPDNSITQPGVYPDQPDTAIAGNAYDFVFQILALKDTTTIFNGQVVNATIDSIKVDNVEGLPKGFTYSCEPNSCTFTHNDVGCIKLSGDPTTADIGVYDITIKTTVFARVALFQLPVKDSITGYQVVVKSNGSASVFEPNRDHLYKIYPNPTNNGIVKIAANSELSNISVCTVAGKETYAKIVLNSNDAVLDLSSVSQGVYVLTFQLGEKRVTKKLIF